MDSTYLSSNSTSTPDDFNAYFSMPSQQSSASSASAPDTNYGGNEFGVLFTANGDLTSAETSFGSNICDAPPTDITWDDYLILTEGLPEGAPSVDTPAGIAPGVSNINTSAGPLTFNVAAGNADINMPAAGFPTLNLVAENTGINVPSGPSTFDVAAGSALANVPTDSPTFIFGAESAGINMPVGFPTLNPAAGNTGNNMPSAPSTFDFTATARSANVNMPAGPQMFDLSDEITGIDMPVGSQTTIEHPSYLGWVNGASPNGTNVGDFTINGAWVGTSQQVRQPINSVHAPLTLSNTHLNISLDTSSEIKSPPKKPNGRSARHRTPQRRWRKRAPSPAALPTTYSNNSSNTSSATQLWPKKSRSSSPSAWPRSKRPRFSRAEPTIRFVHDERSMPANFRANPDNHGRFQYTATGRRKYLNAPGAVQERRRCREGD